MPSGTSECSLKIQNGSWHVLNPVSVDPNFGVHHSSNKMLLPVQFTGLMILPKKYLRACNTEWDIASDLYRLWSKFN